MGPRVGPCERTGGGSDPRHGPGAVVGGQVDDPAAAVGLRFAKRELGPGKERLRRPAVLRKRGDSARGARQSVAPSVIAQLGDQALGDEPGSVVSAGHEQRELVAAKPIVEADVEGKDIGLVENLVVATAVGWRALWFDDGDSSETRIRPPAKRFSHKL